MTRTFLSYAHESAAHKARVLALAQRLRHEGVDCQCDQFVENPPEGWPRWMDRQIREADFVLIVCSPAYRRRFDDDERRGRGLGAVWEGAAVVQQLYEDGGRNERFIPLLLDDTDEEHIPLRLRSATRYWLDRDYEALYRRLTGQPAVRAGPLGPVRRLAALDPLTVHPPGGGPSFLAASGAASPGGATVPPGTSSVAVHRGGTLRSGPGRTGLRITLALGVILAAAVVVWALATSFGGTARDVWPSGTREEPLGVFAQSEAGEPTDETVPGLRSPPASDTGVATIEPDPGTSVPDTAAATPPWPPAGMVDVPPGDYPVGCQPSDACTPAQRADNPRATLRVVEPGSMPASEVGVGLRAVVEFAIDETEVTVADYERCMERPGDARCSPFEQFDNCPARGVGSRPVACVNWTQAQRYCQLRGGARLPSDDEWEVAGRGPTGLAFPWGSQRPGADPSAADGARAECPWAVLAAKAGGGCGKGAPLAVDRFAAFGQGGYGLRDRSWRGVVDLCGNVREWTGSARAGRSGKTLRSVRGGSWVVEPGDVVPLAVRGAEAEGRAFDDLGFRCAQTRP